MDPDQLEPAAVHDHGGLTDTPSGVDSWACALLRRGWDLSRKAAIAGAAATAAPLIAPPLIVLSAAGVVLSIPFAAYLASLAGTNRLMAALLPSSPARPYPTTDQGDDDHVEEEFLDASEEYGQEAPAFGHWDATEDDAVKVENQGGSSRSLLLSRDHGASSDDDNVIQEEGEGDFSVQNSGRDLLISNCEDKKEERTIVEESKSTEYIPQLDFLLSESSGPVFDDEENAVQSKQEVEVAVQKVVQEQSSSSTDIIAGEVVDVQVEIIATAVSEGEVLPLSNLAACDPPADLVTGEMFDMHADIVAPVEPQNEVLPLSNLAACDSPADVVTGEVLDMHVDTIAAVDPQNEVLPVNLAACESLAVVETAHYGGVVGINGMEDIVRDVGDVDKEREDRHFFSLAPMVSVHDDEKMSSGSTLYVSAIVDEMIHQPNQSTGEVLGRNVVSGSKAGYTEEQLREQLDIIRTITGYGAVPSTTLEDELTGLYIFVGVESPVGSRDTSDRLVELNAKLQFLKSIIGVD